MTGRTTTACDGRWRQRYVSVPECTALDVAVIRCDGCGEQQVILGYQGFPSQGGSYPPDMTPEDCVRLALEDRALGRSRGL